MTSKKIITHCAPTLAGIKTASLFNEHYENEKELLAEIKEFNAIYRNRGVKMIPLALKNNVALIYVYRLSDLENDLNTELSKELLTKYGYDSHDIHSLLKHLSLRMENYNEFPHEIGLFLGYPPEDVKGFIDNHAQNFKAVGYWKVYGDVDRAVECFKRYRNCQKIYLNRLNMGFSLSDLVIHK